MWRKFKRILARALAAIQSKGTLYVRDEPDHPNSADYVDARPGSSAGVRFDQVRGLTDGLEVGWEAGGPRVELRRTWASQGEAETWLGECYPQLQAAGVRTVSLYEEKRLVYGPDGARSDRLIKLLGRLRRWLTSGFPTRSRSPMPYAPLHDWHPARGRRAFPTRTSGPQF